MYNCLETEEYTNISLSIIFTIFYPDNKAHTQNIERIWGDIRGNILRYDQQYYTGYIAEFLFKWKFSFSECVEVSFILWQDINKKQIIFFLISIYFDECRMHRPRLSSCTSTPKNFSSNLI